MPTRVLQIGCGVWGKILAQTARDQQVLVAVCDRHRFEAEAAVQGSSIPIFTNIDQAIATSSPDAIVLATPDFSHFDLTRKLLRLGLDVFVEKPLAMSSRQARILIAEAKARDKILMCGLILRYHPALPDIRQALSTLGPIRSIAAIRHDWLEHPRDSNLIWSYGPHDAGLVSYLLGENPSLAITDLKVCGDDQRAIQAHCFVGTHRIEFDWAWDRPRMRQLMINAAYGQLVWQDSPRQFLAINGRQDRLIDPTPPLSLEFAHFLDCVRTRTQPWTSGENSLFAHVLIEAIALALHSRLRSQKPLPMA